jgi:Icc-related predicted phosphoesterase
MIRIAAIGDLHLRGQVPEQVVREVHGLSQRADVLIVAGDITNHGTLRQAELAAELFRLAQLPIFAVLGNHDRRTTRRRAFCRALAAGGVSVLDGESVLIDIRGIRLGIAGVGGSGGGFWPMEGPDTLTRKVSQALAVRARREASRLDSALSLLQSDMTVVVTHFAPTASTLGHEPLVKYPLLGNSELARVIDQHRVDLVVHGHAHLGNPIGRTPGGTVVRNVAHDVTGGIVFHDLGGVKWMASPASHALVTLESHP